MNGPGAWRSRSRAVDKHGQTLDLLLTKGYYRLRTSGLPRVDM